MSAPEVDEVFSVLADPTRRQLLSQLSEHGPLTATELATGFAISRQAVVKHLGAMAGAGLLAAERHGREVRYQVVGGGLDEARRWLTEIGGRWDRRLAALERQVRRR